MAETSPLVFLKKVVVFGSGTSFGVPVIGCDCEVCQSSSPKNKRTRSSILLQNSIGDNIVVDVGPDFRTQMLRENIKYVKHVILTHTHADHCHGLDDLRPLYFCDEKPVYCYVPEEYIPEIKQRFFYLFTQTDYQNKKPKIEIIPIKENQCFEICGLTFEPLRLAHGGPYTFAFKVDNFAYATDFKFFSEEQKARWKNKIEVMIASGLQFGTHNTHSTIPETLALFEELSVKKAYLSHLSHKVDYERDSHLLPPHVQFAFDGLSLADDLSNKY